MPMHCIMHLILNFFIKQTCGRYILIVVNSSSIYIRELLVKSSFTQSNFTFLHSREFFPNFGYEKNAIFIILTTISFNIMAQQKAAFNLAKEVWSEDVKGEPGENSSNEWLEAVSDEEYNKIK